MEPVESSAIIAMWLKAFVFSLAVEVPIFVVVGRWRARNVPTPRIWRCVLGGCAGTIISHPIFWYAVFTFLGRHWLTISACEIAIALFEAAVFYAIARPIGFKRALAASAAANAASYGLGFAFWFVLKLVNI